MKTDDLVALLAAGVEPVDTQAVRKRFQRALLLGLLGSFLVMCQQFGLRDDFDVAMWIPMFWFKLAFALGLAVPAVLLTARLGRPGVPIGRLWLALPIPWLALSALAVLALTEVSQEKRLALVLGSSWTECAFNISLVSVPVFVGMFWTLRGMAPTRPALAGASAGLASAALGVFIYALHCPEMEAPFLAVWYVLGLAIPTSFGALIGPKLLRW